MMKYMVILLLLAGYWLTLSPALGANSTSGDYHQALANMAAASNQQYQVIQSILAAVDKLKLDSQISKNETSALQGEILQLATDLINIRVAKSKLLERNNALNETLVRERRRREKLDADVLLLRATLVAKQRELTATLNKTGSFNKDVDLFHQNLVAMDNQLTTLARKQDPRVMFAATNPDGFKPLTSGPVQFRRLITNEGNAFNQNTSTFTSPTAGVYYFFATVQKTRDHTELGCHVIRDGTNLAYAYAQDGTSSSNPGATNAVYVHLDVGDRVWLGQCTGGTHVRETTSFSGALVAPD